MYKCVKIINKIFIKLKNLMFTNKIKNIKILNLPKKISLKFFKFFILTKESIKKFEYKKFLLKIRLFLFKFLNAKRSGKMI